MSAAPSREIKLFGTDEPVAESRVLRAGPLSAEFDAGSLRYIRHAGREAIRAISYVVRDRYWGTYNPAISGLEVEEAPDRFRVRYRAACGDDGQSLTFTATITGSSDGSLVFEVEAVPETGFLTNRTGFVVLHPLDGVSGRPVTVRRVDGGVDRTRFPDEIDPKQPIEDIRALTHEVAPGLEVTCTMNGDTFEMEDQRNWTDASYKTYVRPLSLPHPYTLPAGEPLRQSVTLEFGGEAAGAAGAPSAAPAVEAGGGEGLPPVAVRIGGTQGRAPVFGMAIEPRYAAAALACGDELARLSPRFLSLYLDPREADAASALRDAAAVVAAAGGAEVGLEVVAPGEPDTFAGFFAEVARHAAGAGLRPASVAVSPAGNLSFVIPGTVFPDSLEFDALFAAARSAFPEARIGGGSFVYFTELNRKPPPTDALDFVCHSTSALVHAADDRSVTESIECLPYVIRSCRAFFPRVGYRIGPCGIGSRASPFGGEPTPNPDAARVTMTRADPRQRGLLGAAWHLGYAARTAEGGVDSVILGAAAGEFGCVHLPDAGYRQPWFDEAGGGLFPVFHVLRGVYAASGAARLAARISEPRNVQVLALRTDRGTEAWLGNLSGEPRAVQLEFEEGEGAAGPGPMALSMLDEESFEACAADAGGFDATERPLDGGGRSFALTLAPYAVARLRTAS